MAREAGYFKENGLDAKLVYMEGGRLSIQSLLSGSTQFMAGDAVSALTAVAGGAAVALPMCSTGETRCATTHFPEQVLTNSRYFCRLSKKRKLREGAPSRESGAPALSVVGLLVAGVLLSAMASLAAALLVGLVKGVMVGIGYSAASTAAIYLLMLLVLLFRPRGLFGERITRFE